MRLFRLTRPLLGMIDAETAHRLALAALRLGVVQAGQAIASPALAISVMGLSFPNPVGLAAGFDKDATVVDAVQYGFSPFVLTDCVGDRSRPAHEANIFDMTAKYADALGAKEAVDYLRRLSE